MCRYQQMSNSILIIGERCISARLISLLESRAHAVQFATNSQQALELLANNGSVDLILCEYRMAQLNGFELVERIKRYAPEIPVILIAASGTIANAVAAMKGGAYDYLVKPFSFERIQSAVERALEFGKLHAENGARRDQLEDRPLLESKSSAMRRLLEIARQAARSEASILLMGESGTGKNLLARQMHHWSSRRQHPFVVVNCNTLSKYSLEVELFGYVGGTCTGGTKHTSGCLEAADGGTLFLDEIGDLSPDLQTKFLRFVEGQSFARIGGAETIRVNTRIIAASSRDLAAEMAGGRFRDDLFYRLNVIGLRIPPLRKRFEDILPLAKRIALQTEVICDHRPEICFSPEVAAILSCYHWPGNVRELRNVIERAVVLSGGDTIVPEHLPDKVLRGCSDLMIAAAPKNMEEMERQLIIRVLAESPTLEDAAQTLGINSSTLWRKRKCYRIQ
jgi:two-component system, NtrC family, response regulator AlgB